MSSKIAFFISLCVFQSAAYSQIIVNDIEPEIDDFYTYEQFESQFDPGPSGENVEWDYSSVGIPDFESTSFVVSPDVSPFGTNFPLSTKALAANVENVGSLAIFLGFTNNLLIEYGAVGQADQEFDINKYSDPAERFQTPLAYQNTWDDGFEGVFFIAGDFDDTLYTFIGSLAYEVDAYGMLKIHPFLSLNALRVKTVQEEEQYFMGGGGEVSSTILTTSYAWFVEEIPVPAIIIDHTQFYLFGQLFDESYSLTRIKSYSNIVLEVDELKKDHSISIYPNPTSDFITFNFDQTGEVNLRIMNIDGKMVKSQTVNSNTKVNVSNLTPGFYMVEFSIDGSFYSKSTFIIAR